MRGMDLREYRKSLDLDQASAAEKAKLSPAAFCSAELGTRLASGDTMLKIMAWSKGIVTANDLLQAWAAKQGKKYPAASKAG